MTTVTRLLPVFLIGLLLLVGCQRPTPPVASQYEVADDSPAPAAAAQPTEQPAAPAEAAENKDPSPPVENSAEENVSAAENKPAVPPAAEPEDLHPFPRRVEMPPLPEGMTWLNTSGPLRLQDLKGKFVLLDFWTYCCINCMHVLPELKKLEEKYPNELVVIGVHSAKFETEKDTQNIEEAILRYKIQHPVVNDANHQIWNSFGVSSWPTLLMVDPAGEAVWMNSGETKFETLDAILQAALPYYEEQKLLDSNPIHFDLLAHKAQPKPLSFPGKVLADEASGRLFITDSNHNRIVITDLEGKLLETIGSGAEGRNDGNYIQATFKQPQGVALVGDTLYVADTENHLIRQVDLKAKNVITIAGTGKQGGPWPGLENLRAYSELPERWVGKPSTTALNSPWALLVHDDAMYIAMAGPHQIWKMPLDGSEIGPYAGNGREDIVDGPLLPEEPYALGYSSFAQPSGLASDGTWLYVADSEGSSIRAVPFDPEQEVKTVVGTSELPGGRLFIFGDIDGPKEEARLQHVLGVAHHEGSLYIADTYNNKIKVVDAQTGAVKTLAGTSESGLSDGAAEAASFDEPAGLSYAAGKLYVADTNNHAIRVVEVATGSVTTLEIAGLEPPAPPQSPAKPSFAGAPVLALDPVTIKPVDGHITLQFKLNLPPGWKLNPLAPMGYLVEAEGDAGVIDRSAIDKFEKPKPADANLAIKLPVSGEGKESVDVSLIYYYCQDGGEGICKVGSIVWQLPLTIAADADKAVAQLPLAIQP